MGNFYSNIVVTDVLSDRVVDWMRARGSAAFIEVSDLGCVIFDEAADSDYSHEDLAREINNAFGGRALVVSNHDDDILTLEVYQNGAVILTDDGYVFDVERHEALFERLSLPMSSCGSSFEYITNGDASGLSHPSAVLISIPAAT